VPLGEGPVDDESLVGDDDLLLALAGSHVDQCRNGHEDCQQECDGRLAADVEGGDQARDGTDADRERHVLQPAAAG